jgi:hypothetical protein
MSALPPKADLCSATSDVRFGPIADIAAFERRTESCVRYSEGRRPNVVGFTFAPRITAACQRLSGKRVHQRAIQNLFCHLAG